MEKRTFLKTGLFFTLGAALSPLVQACSPKSAAAQGVKLAPPATRRAKPFELPPLPYPVEALEPHIDKMTMEIHHGKHHAAYVKNLNEALQGAVYADYELIDILQRITGSEADKKIRNNAGGHWNHSLFWQVMKPGGGGKPEGALAAAIDGAFGSFDAFKEQFSTAAKSVFGSGWAWLCKDADGKLFVTATPNQDNPLMLQIAAKTGTPIFGIDVWEHAYYLKYQNRRPDYVTAFWNVVNWREVSKRFSA